MFALTQQLVAAGYTAKQILNFLADKIDGLPKSISGARSGGYSDDQILQFLSKKLPRGQSKRAQESASAAERYMSGIGLKTKEEKAQSRQKNLQGLTGLAAGALTAYAGYRALSQAPKAISAMLGKQPGAQIGNVPVAGQTPPMAAAPVSPQVPATPQIPAVEKPAITSQPKIPRIQELGLTQRADTMHSAGNPPKVIASVLQQNLTPEQKRFVKKENIDLVQEVQQYLQSKTPNIGKTPEESPVSSEITPVKQPISPEIVGKPSESVGIPEIEAEAEAAPGKSVVLPSGEVGQIEKVDPKHRYVSVNIDGKKRNIKFSDIEVEPENVVEFVNHIAQIPESERSRLVSYFAYQPESRTLAVQFHNGNFYTYSDVEPEKIKPIVEATGVAKTTGRDEYGEHVAGRPDSRGAALIEEIINDPKYKKAKKGEEKNANYQAFDTLYDYWKAFRRVSKKKRKEIGA